ncbi:MAG: SPOR domain-containing protein [Gammaproteobacteria bacterium]|nr:SPOR domain-containing protein [Gammaproteobacteria bacterium]MDX5375380.1 SPOR domain-containing protein [Gammaproteobacteria bacterium]
MDSHILSADSLARLGLDQQPFLSQWQDAFAFGDASLDMTINVCLEHLRDASPPILIKGEHGIGKSAQLQRLMARGDDLHCCLIQAGPETSMAAVDHAVRLAWQPHPRHGDPKQLSLDRFLAALCEDGMRPVLVVDDAHHLEPKVLGTLLNLKQHMHDRLGQTIGLVLAAERGIDATLSLLEGRLRIVGMLYTIAARPFNREQTAAYLEHRLRAAGLAGPMPLNAQDIEAIQQQSGGLPGDVNRLAVARLQTAVAGTSARTGDDGATALPSRLLMPAAITLVVLGLLAALYGLIAGLLTPGEEVGAPRIEAGSERLALPAPETTAPAAPRTPAPAPATAAPGAELPNPPEEAVPRASATPPEEEPPVTEPPPARMAFDFSEPPVLPEPTPAASTPAAPPAARAETEAEVEPRPAPAPTVTTRPREEAAPPQATRGTLHDALWLLRQDPEHYTIQALAVSTEAAARRFYETAAPGLEAGLAPTRRAGQTWHVLVLGTYPDADTARRAIPALPDPVQKNRPFIRRIGDLQEAILAAR